MGHTEIIKKLGPLQELTGLVTTVGGERQRIPVHSPLDGEEIGSIPACTDADVQEALDRARKAQSEWAQQPMSTRKAILLRFHEQILDQREKILDLLQLESGKARLHAYEEVLDIALNCRYYAFHGPSHLKPRRRKGALPFFTKTVEHHGPIGVIGIISPWNYPLALAISDPLPALKAGNTVVLKPAAQTSLVALLAVRIFRESGLPPDVFQVVTGHGSSVGSSLVSGSDCICFTGGTETGKQVARQAADRLIKCSMELGGKNPMLVFNDASLSKAVDGALRGCFTNAGQLCISFERLYVQSGVYEKFVELFVRRTRELSLGAGFDYKADIGALISEEHLSGVRDHVEDAVSKGARVLSGGRTRPDLGPCFFEPTILSGVTSEMKVFAEETFGPVVSIYQFDETEDAVRAANDSEYGLNASIWTRNIRQGRSLAQRIRCGTVNINESYAAAWGSVDAPMGGMKSSGVGRRHGSEGILKYTEAQTVSVQRFISIKNPSWLSKLTYVRGLTSVLRMVRRIPGIR